MNSRSTTQVITAKRNMIEKNWKNVINVLPIREPND